MAEDASTEHAHRPPSDPTIGIDVGRHRLLLSDRQTHRLVGLRPDGRGIVIRWYGPAGQPPQRVVDLLIDQAGSADHHQAEDLAAAIGHLARTATDDEAPDLDPGRSIRTVVAIPPALGPAGRQALVRGLGRAGWRLDGSCLVERPVAALAVWLAHRVDTGSEPMVIIDNDGGQISAVVADPHQRRLVACHPLSGGPHDEPEQVVSRFRRLVELGAAVTYDGPIVRPSDWPSQSASIGRVVLAGSGADHPLLAQLVAAVLPAAPVEIGAGTTDPATDVAIGLTHLDRLTDWRACWPTLSVVAGGHVVVPAGPPPQPVTVAIAGADTVSLAVDDRPVDVSIGSASAPGIRISPAPDEAVVKVLDDGRLLVLGPRGATSIGVRVAWPCPGTTIDDVVLQPIGRRAIELEDEAGQPAPISSST